jgi:predicted RNA methylase
MAAVGADELSRLEQDASLREPGRLRERSDALDRLDAWRVLAPPGDGGGDRIDALEAELLAVDASLYAQLRDVIRRGDEASVLLDLVRANREDEGDPSSDRYDHLDALVSGLLRIEESSTSLASLDAGMVFYQPTPARHIFDAIERCDLNRDDVLVDLGAGLGHVPLLAAICTGARCIGIEWQAAYVEAAQRCASELGLARVHFEQGDVRDADLSEGSVFYLYTPFEGAMLREVLDRLRAEAGRRAIRLCTLGPCTAMIAGETWLRADGPCDRHRPVVFRNV